MPNQQLKIITGAGLELSLSNGAFMQQKSIPFGQLLNQRHNIAALAQNTVINAFPMRRGAGEHKDVVPLQYVIEAPRSPLISHYLNWARVPNAQRNTRRVPAHMFSQWSVPLAMRVLVQNHFGLSNLVNLGCDIKIGTSIRRGEKLFLSGQIVNVDEDVHRTLLTVKVVTATERDSTAIEAQIHCMLPKMSLLKPPIAKAKFDHNWETAGAWAVDRHDGLRFALLTGDFNPVHWIEFAARQSPFGQIVLHGFGSLSLTWVALQTREVRNPSIRHISCRFIRPVPLPSTSMYVLRGMPRTSGVRRFSVRCSHGMNYIMGTYK